MKKIIAPICFTISIILLVVFGIFCTETMLKDDNKLINEKPMIIALKEVVGDYDSYQQVEKKELAKLDDDHKLVKAYLIKQNNKVKAYVYIAEMKTHSANKTPMTILYAIKPDKTMLKPYVLASDANDYYNLAENESKFNDLFSSMSDKTVSDGNFGDDFKIATGATFSSNAIINGAKLARTQFYTDINETAPLDPQGIINKLLEKVNVTNGVKIEYEPSQETVKNTYQGVYETKQVYVFESEKTINFDNGYGADTVTIKMLTVVNQETGAIEKVYANPFSTHGVSATDFNIIGKDSLDDFQSISGATYSSNGAKAILTDVLAEYKFVKNLAVNKLLSKVNVTDGELVEVSLPVDSTVKNVYQGIYETKQVYVFESEKTINFDNGYGADTVTIKMLTVVNQETGAIEKVYTNPFSTHGVSATDFNIIGKDSLDNFQSISGATYSSNGAKAILTDVLAIYSSMKGAE